MSFLDVRIPLVNSTHRNLSRADLETLLDKMNEWLVQLRDPTYPEYPGDTMDEKTESMMDVDGEGSQTKKTSDEGTLSGEVARLRVLLRDNENGGELGAKKLAQEFAVYIEEWFA
jgi:hypothetical protein